LINSSVGGAMIEGFDVYPLDEVFTKFANKKLDKSNIVDSVDYKNTFDKSTVCKNLKKDYETLAKLSPLLTRIFELSKRLKKELVRAKIVSSPALELNKKIIALFSEITKDYFFSSRIGRVCTFRMYIEIEYLLRVQLDSISYKDMVELVDTCVECFEDAIKRLDYIFEYLDIAIKNMEKNYEICNSKG